MVIDYIVNLAMLDDERPLDSLADGCHADGAVRFPEDYDQWFPILSFDGSRVTITRPTDAMETTVIQPVRVPSTAVHPSMTRGTGEGSSGPGAGGWVHPSMTRGTSTVPGKVGDGSATQTSTTSTNGHHDAGSPAGVGSRSIGDTVWLQMSKRSEIQTTDGRMIKLAPTTSRTDASDQSANSLAGPVESAGKRAAMEASAEARSERVAERHRAMVERRKRRLRATIVVSAVVTVISLIALIASIA